MGSSRYWMKAEKPLQRPAPCLLTGTTPLRLNDQEGRVDAAASPPRMTAFGVIGALLWRPTWVERRRSWSSPPLMHSIGYGVADRITPGPRTRSSVPGSPEFRAPRRSRTACRRFRQPAGVSSISSPAVTRLSARPKADLPSTSIHCGCHRSRGIAAHATHQAHPPTFLLQAEKEARQALVDALWRLAEAPRHCRRRRPGRPSDPGSGWWLRRSGR